MASNTEKLTTKERVPNRSANDCSHNVNYALPVGKLIPVLCDEVLPNTEVSLGALANVALANFATEFQGKIDFRMEAFFVPFSTLWDGWRSFEVQKNQYDPTGSVPANVPTFTVPVGFTANRLLNALRFNGSGSSTNTYNALPLIAYHKIWNDYYRDSRIQKSPFLPADQTGHTDLSSLPYTYGTKNFTLGGSNYSKFADGVALSDLRARNYDRDYFNTAMLAASLAMDDKCMVTVSNNKFDIASLRLANVHTEFKEMLARVGNDYDSVSMALFNTVGMKEYSKSVYLGQCRSRVYNNGVFVNNLGSRATDFQDSDSGYSIQYDSRNPYISNGYGGSISCPETTMDNSLIDNFTTRERGVIMVLASIVPIPTYCGNSSRMWIHKEFGDFGLARFEKTANQPIYAFELQRNAAVAKTGVFGWSEKYAEYKTIPDYSSQEFGDAGVFAPFVLSREFTSAPTLSNSFIEIPEEGLDDVLAVRNNLGRLHRANIGFIYHKVHPLSDYAIPTLVDTDNHTEHIARGTNRL